MENVKAFLIWCGLICCSVVNGLLYHVGQEVDLVKVLMVLPCVGAIYLLYIHRKISKDWTTSPTNPWIEYRFPIFSLTLFLSLVITVILWFESESCHAVLAGFITSTVTSAIAFWREKDYVEEIYGG